jgi:hypothetical protein
VWTAYKSAAVYLNVFKKNSYEQLVFADPIFNVNI